MISATCWQKGKIDPEDTVTVVDLMPVHAFGKGKLALAGYASIQLHFFLSDMQLGLTIQASTALFCMHHCLHCNERIMMC